MQAYNAGLREFGENYVQEGVDKIQALASYADIQWHFIGPLQSNKTALVAEHFQWVHSIDRLKIARRLNDQRSVRKPPLNICVQVNISGEAQKSGVAMDEVLSVAQQIDDLPRLTLRGLMAIPNAKDDQSQLCAQFNQMFDLFNQLKTLYGSVDTLSMGMSNDWKTALDCGATTIRLGTALFGPRSTQPSTQK